MENANADLNDSDETEKLVRRMKTELEFLFNDNQELKTSFHIERFLRARENNYEKAKKMMSKYMEKRKRLDMKKIAAMGLDFPKMKLLQSFHLSNHYNHDKQGRVIAIELMGRYDVEGLANHFTDEELENYLMSIVERTLFVEFPVLSKKFGRRIDRMIVIVDMKGTSFFKMMDSKFRRFLKIMSKIASDNFPEILEKSVLINAPLGIETFWNITKSFLDKKTAAKVDFYSGDGSKFLNTIVDRKDLPAEIGGTSPIPLSGAGGINNEAVLEAIARRSFFLEDRTPEYQYFYTAKERLLVLEKGSDTVRQNQIYKSQPNFDDSKIPNIQTNEFGEKINKTKSLTFDNLSGIHGIVKRNYIKDREVDKHGIRVVQYFRPGIFKDEKVSNNK